MIILLGVTTSTTGERLESTLPWLKQSETKCDGTAEAQYNETALHLHNNIFICMYKLYRRKETSPIDFSKTNLLFK